jgi:AcrR family transcriptional regulator
LAEVLESGARAGTLRHCDFDAMARAILGLVNWAPLAHQWLDGPSPTSHRRLSDALSSMVFDGVAADRKAPTDFAPIDLDPLRFTPSHAFDRAAINAARMEALLLNASRLFNRQGFDATSLQEIMASIGATKRTLYRHLTDKQALAAACYERAFKIFEHVRNRMIDYPGTRLQAYGAAVHAIASAYMRKDILPIAPPVCYASLRPEDQKFYDERMRTFGASYSKTIHDGVAEGSIAPIDEDARTALFPGLFSGVVKDDIPNDPAQCERIARAISQLFCVGLRAP